MADPQESVPHVNSPFEAISYRLRHTLPLNTTKSDKLTMDPVSQSEWMFRANSYRTSADTFVKSMREQVWNRNLEIALFFGLVGVVIYAWKP